jgi:hypothetical protein
MTYATYMETFPAKNSEIPIAKYAQVCEIYTKILTQEPVVPVDSKPTRSKPHGWLSPTVSGRRTVQSC